jgi:hypothetical protein
MGRYRRRAAAVERALHLAEPDRLILPFAMTGAWTLLTALPPQGTSHAALAADIFDAARGAGPGDAAAPGPAEELSPSELRVLRYLPTNLARPPAPPTWTCRSYPMPLTEGKPGQLRTGGPHGATLGAPGVAPDPPAPTVPARTRSGLHLPRCARHPTAQAKSAPRRKAARERRGCMAGLRALSAALPGITHVLLLIRLS